MTDPRPTIRLDKWLWYARFFKSRGLASRTVAAGHVRVNSERVSKAAQAVGAGDTLTFPQARQIRVVRIVDTGSRRGPAPEAQALYDDLTPPPDPATPPLPRKGARPTKLDRRQMERFRQAGHDSGPGGEPESG